MNVTRYSYIKNILNVMRSGSGLSLSIRNSFYLNLLYGSCLSCMKFNLFDKSVTDKSSFTTNLIKQKNYIETNIETNI